jgi:hypothetical protein
MKEEMQHPDSKKTYLSILYNAQAIQKHSNLSDLSKGQLDVIIGCLSMIRSKLEMLR